MQKQLGLFQEFYKQMPIHFVTNMGLLLVLAYTDLNFY